MAKKSEKFSVTRRQIIDAALSLRGVRFLHQGRDVSGCDCVGLLVVIGNAIGYPDIFDVEGYRRTPSAQVIRETLEKNCDEISLEEVKAGDIYLMRTGGRKPRHAAVKISDETDLARGIEPQLIHAIPPYVCVEPARQWKDNFVTGFRVRGLKG